MSDEELNKQTTDAEQEPAVETEGDSAAAEATETDADATAEPQVESDADVIESLKQQVVEAQDQLLRVKAEAENIRRRTDKDVSQARKFALERFSNDLIPVIDSLEMGVKASKEDGADIEKLREGSEMTLEMFSSVLSKYAITTLDPQGEKFDPTFHQAMTTQEDPSVPADTVLTVFQKGYLLNERLIRPALVVVSKGGPKAKPEEPPKKIDEHA